MTDLSAEIEAATLTRQGRSPGVVMRSLFVSFALLVLLPADDKAAQVSLSLRGSRGADSATRGRCNAE